MSKVSNEDLVQKAVATTDALASAGKLNATQADAFIDYVVDMSGLKNNARVVRVKTQWDIDKIGVGNRVAMPKTEATAPSNRRGITTSKVSITAKTIMVPFEISDEFREENLEGASVEDHIIRMMAAQLANDLEELYLQGDASLPPAVLESMLKDEGSSTQYVKDTYLALMNGWLQKCRASGTTVNAVDVSNASIGPSVFSSMLKAMPDKFKRNLNEMRFMAGSDLEQNYREKIATRQTGSGESALNSIQPLTPFGVPLVGYPLFPFNPRVTVHATGATGVAIPLGFAPIVSGSEIVVLQTIGGTPTTKYTGGGTDYTMDYAAGTCTPTSNLNTFALKITFLVAPQMILTPYRNLIVGIGRDITIEKDRDIFKGVNQYAITCKIGCEFEEQTAVVWAKNIGESV